MVNAYSLLANGNDWDLTPANQLSAALGRIDDVGLYPVKAPRYLVTPINSTYYRFDGLDGAKDDSNAAAHTVINQAIDDLTAGRTWYETVQLRGTFSITGPITVDDYTLLDLRQAYLALAASVDDDMFQNGDQTNGNTRITILGGRLDGNKANQSAGYAFDFQLVKHPQFYDVEIANFKEHGIYLYRGGSGGDVSNIGVIQNCFLYNQDKSDILLNEAADVKVLGCELGQADEYNIYLGASDNCLAAGNLIYAGNHGVYGVDSDALTLTGNRIDECQSHGVRLETSAATSNYHVITGNTLFRCGQAAANTHDGIVLTNTTYSTVAGNTIEARSLQRYAVRETGTSDFNTINGNTLVGHQTSAVLAVGTSTTYDVHPMASASLDLSAAGADVLVWTAPRKACLVGYDLLYTEASSADAGVTVEIGRYQDGVALDDDYFDQTTSEGSKNLGYTTTIMSAALTQQVISRGDAVTAGTAGGKVGTGEVCVKLRIVYGD
jgi:hypothetical protein